MRFKDGDIIYCKLDKVDKHEYFKDYIGKTVRLFENQGLTSKLLIMETGEVKILWNNDINDFFIYKIERDIKNFNI